MIIACIQPDLFSVEHLLLKFMKTDFKFFMIFINVEFFWFDLRIQLNETNCNLFILLSYFDSFIFSTNKIFIVEKRILIVTLTFKPL